MAAAAAQGGRTGGGGGSSGAGGGSSCATGSSRSGLLDKVRSRFLGTVEAWGGPGGGEPTFSSPPPFSSAAFWGKGGPRLAHPGNPPGAGSPLSTPQTQALSSSGLLSFSGVCLVLNASRHSFRVI